MTSRLSRRRFLSTAAAIGATPAFVPRCSLGQDGIASPSGRITVAVIGCGKMAGDYHLPELLKQPDVQLVAVCEVDGTRREHARQRVESFYKDRDRRDPWQLPEV